MKKSNTQGPQARTARARSPSFYRGGGNEVRIIGGVHRGRRVRFPEGAALRPTPDRVRETLFNWLGQDLAGRTTLEPYAGSGVLSLEALSRGAARARAYDRDPRVVRALLASAASLGLAALEAAVGDALALLARETARYDVIFLDPPFASDPWPALWPLCDAHLAEGGLVYAEAPCALAAPQGFAMHRQGRAGQVHYHLFVRASPTARGEPLPC